MDFHPHHTAVSVEELAPAEKFYELFGYEPVHRYLHPDGSFAIVHLRLEGYVLELFWYADQEPGPTSSQELATDLPRIGTKHHGVRVSNVDAAHSWVQEQGLKVEGAVREGRTGVRYFFVKDPSGNFFEISQDDRQLSPL